jgi:CDP-6-deoxy-D-xylo-4-hexulose-3-dehydrase
VKPDAGFTRKEIVEFLEQHKIGTRNLFGGNLTRQPAFLGKGVIADALPKSDIVMENSFWIGCHPGITEAELSYMVEVFVRFGER